MDGNIKNYVVDYIQIVETPEIDIEKAQNSSILLLMTSYSFGNWNGADNMRFAVVARELEKPRNSMPRIAFNESM
jgi:hypothetical protein